MIGEAATGIRGEAQRTPLHITVENTVTNVTGDLTIATIVAATEHQLQAPAVMPGGVGAAASQAVTAAGEIR